MKMNYKQWEEVLDAVNKETDLSKDNVIEKIQKELKAYQEEYEEWKEAGFGVNYLFEGKDDKLALLHLAASRGYAKIVNLLIENDASVDVEYEGVTPLHCAAAGGHTEIVEILVKNGAKVDAKINAGETKSITPLHCAAKKGHTEIVRILIANGADPLLKDKDGKTPRDLAECDFIKKLLKEAEEKQLKRQALNKSISAGGANVLLGTAAAVALFVTGTVAVELIPIAIAVVAVTAAALVVGGITYGVLKPSTKVSETKKEKVAKGAVPVV